MDSNEIFASQRTPMGNALAHPVVETHVRDQTTLSHLGQQSLPIADADDEAAPDRFDAFCARPLSTAGSGPRPCFTRQSFTAVQRFRCGCSTVSTPARPPRSA